MGNIAGKMKPSASASGNDDLEFDVKDIIYASKEAICGHKASGEYFSCNTQFWVFVSVDGDGE